MPTFKIRHRDGHVICDGEADSFGKFVETELRTGTDLSGANLANADLRLLNLNCVRLPGVDLRHSRLAGTDLRNAYLKKADLREAECAAANFGYADLRETDLRETWINLCQGAKFEGAILRFSCHPVMAEILRRAADGNVSKLKVAGLIAITPYHCWDDYLETRNTRLIDWALGVIEPHARRSQEAGFAIPSQLRRALEARAVGPVDKPALAPAELPL